MATKGKIARAGKTNPKVRARRRALRQVRSVALAGLALFVFLSLATYAPLGSGRGNLCGTVGHAIAGPVLGVLGFGSFVLFGMLGFWAGAALFRQRSSHPLLKAGGILLLTLSASAFLGLVIDPDPYFGEGLHGPGGLFGAALAGRLEGLFGQVGAFIFATVGTIVGLTLATDWLIVDLGRDAILLGGRLKAASAALLPHLSRSLCRVRPALASVLGSYTPSGTAVEEPPAPAEGKKKRNRQERRRAVDEPPVVDREDEAPPDEPDVGVELQPDMFTGEAEPVATARPKRKPRKGATPAATKKSKPRRSGCYEFPPLDLLDPVKNRDPRTQEGMIKENGEILEETLADFKVEAEVVDYRRGPVVTLYELDLAAGVKVNRIHNLSEDLAVALKAPSVRVVAPLPGKDTIGVEVPNPVRDDVRLRSLVSSDVFERNPGFLPIFLGTDVAGMPLIEDLTTMPHVLIAGATGSGKSVCINSVLASLLLTRTPEQVRLILIDPKHVELAFFSKVPHLMSPVVTDMKKALSVLEWLVDQMEERYALFHSMEVRNIHSYNELGPKKIRERKIELGIPVDDEELAGLGFPDRLPYVVLVVDELADLMMVAGKEIENLITRLAQKSRAVGIHIVLATQRPSTDVITGLIKANMPCRMSFQVASKIDSRVILDQNGAEKLLGRGDMLYLPPRTSHLVRSQGTFVSDGEVKRIVKFLADRTQQDFEPSLQKAQTAQILGDEDKDPLYEGAVEIILREQRGSASLLQRALGVGYTRGSRLMDQMHKEGIVGSYKGSKAREVLFSLEEYEKLKRARPQS